MSQPAEARTIATLDGHVLADELESLSPPVLESVQFPGRMQVAA